MNPLNLLTDTYERPARLYPALLLISPVVVTGVAIFSVQLTALQSVAAIGIGLGGAFLLTQLARDAGKKIEPSLFRGWGGMPSVSIFRHSNARLDPITKARYHKELAKVVKGTKAPSREEEEMDPAGADQIYSAWSHFLRIRAREDARKYGILLKENISYGYRRNILGVRRWGITFSLVAICTGVTLLVSAVLKGHPLNMELCGALAFSVIVFVLWLVQFTSGWVRMPAEEYAARLAETVETLSGNRRDSKRKNET